MDKKEISCRTTIKAIITGFVSYGVIIIFIFLLILAIANHFLGNIVTSNVSGLYITLPIMASLIIYLITQLLCKLSTYDVFKKCKTNPNNYDRIFKFLTLFFIICIILSIVLFFSLLYLNLQFQSKTIEYTVLKYREIFSAEHTKMLQDEMKEIYNASKINLIRSTVILEIGFTISFLSLIPYQIKMIKKYNKF